MVSWTAEKDQTLVKGIFAFCDIKNSAPLLKYLAAEIGEDCTAKAVSHRLNNIRATGKPLNANRSATSTPTKPVATPKTPRSKSSAAKPKPSAKPVRSSTADSDDSEDLQGLASSPSVSRKRARSKPKTPFAPEIDDEEDEGPYVPIGKRVKTEPADADVEFGVGVGFVDDLEEA